MTREQKIRKEATEITHLSQFGHSGRDMSVAYDAFILGAQWADKTMINKACRWLDQQLFIKYDSDAVTRFINNFRKAMEE